MERTGRFQSEKSVHQVGKEQKEKQGHRKRMNTKKERAQTLCPAKKLF